MYGKRHTAQLQWVCITIGIYTKILQPSFFTFYMLMLDVLYSIPLTCNYVKNNAPSAGYKATTTAAAAAAAMACLNWLLETIANLANIFSVWNQTKLMLLLVQHLIVFPIY